jgi:hypothetical protein
VVRPSFGGTLLFALLFSLLDKTGGIVVNLEKDITKNIITELEDVGKTIEETLKEITDDLNKESNDNSQSSPPTKSVSRSSETFSTSSSSISSSSSTSSSTSSTRNSTVASPIIDYYYPVGTHALDSITQQIIAEQAGKACMTPVAGFPLIKIPCAPGATSPLSQTSNMQPSYSPLSTFEPWIRPESVYLPPSSPVAPAVVTSTHNGMPLDK